LGRIGGVTDAYLNKLRRPDLPAGALSADTAAAAKESRSRVMMIEIACRQFVQSCRQRNAA